ncbi:MAG: DUF1311 domain-containing protein [Saprospirales bacterium]|nr:DUF1311 domain-containing protein [Saprospirales bacterium]MBK8489833.1 DUF1311 domain-containing protein [Saprospirales bacterium]
MRYILTIFISIICLTGFSQTQVEMNREANESYKKADKELNDIYKTILTEYKSDTVFIKNLQTAQRIWITFRDAELKVKYPETDTRYYGSVYPMCVSIYLEKLTRERITTLKAWTEGVEEGDACNGSLKFKEK